MSVSGFSHVQPGLLQANLAGDDSDQHVRVDGSNRACCELILRGNTVEHQGWMPGTLRIWCKAFWKSNSGGFTQAWSSNNNAQEIYSLLYVPL